MNGNSLLVDAQSAVVFGFVFALGCHWLGKLFGSLVVAFNLMSSEGSRR